MLQTKYTASRFHEFTRVKLHHFKAVPPQFRDCVLGSSLQKHMKPVGTMGVASKISSIFGADINQSES